MDWTTTTNRPIEKADILPMEDYGRLRDQRRRDIAEVKKPRRVAIGPDVTLYFENFATMLHQVHEMLFVEKGGDEQLADELAAYNPLIPDGANLVATLMIEIPDAARRKRVLKQLVGIESAVAITIGEDVVPALADDDVERTTADGKTSSVHFLRFHFSSERIARFRDPAVPVAIRVEHPAYRHATTLSEATRRSLAADFA